MPSRSSAVSCFERVTTVSRSRTASGRRPRAPAALIPLAAPPGCITTACIQRSRRSSGVESGMSAVHYATFVAEPVRAGHFALQDVELRDVRIPFEQGRGIAAPALHFSVQVPDGIDDAAVVRVDAVRAVVRVAREVNLHHAIVRNGLEVLEGVEIVIAAGDVHVVY